MFAKLQNGRDRELMVEAPEQSRTGRLLAVPVLQHDRGPKTLSLYPQKDRRQRGEYSGDSRRV